MFYSILAEGVQIEHFPETGKCTWKTIDVTFNYCSYFFKFPDISLFPWNLLQELVGNLK